MKHLYNTNSTCGISFANQKRFSQDKTYLIIDCKMINDINCCTHGLVFTFVVLSLKFLMIINHENQHDVVCLFICTADMLVILSLFFIDMHTLLWGLAHKKREMGERGEDIERERGTFRNRAFFYDTLFVFISHKKSFFSAPIYDNCLFPLQKLFC